MRDFILIGFLFAFGVCINLYFKNQEKQQVLDNVRFEQIHCPELVQAETIYCEPVSILQSKFKSEKPQEKQQEKQQVKQPTEISVSMIICIVFLSVFLARGLHENLTRTF